jgi:adenine deaminase
VLVVSAIPEACRHRVRLRRPLQASDFRVAAPVGLTEVKAHVMHPRNVDPRLENMVHVLPVRDGAVQRDFARGITKLAIVERYKLTGNIGACMWELGFREGAIAWTINHDHHNPGVIGATDEDMAIAANRCAQIDGGYVVVKDGRVLAELSLPIGGLMTHEDPDSGPISSKALAEHPSDKITFMNLTCDPYTYALTDLGLFQLKTGKKVPIVLA